MLEPFLTELCKTTMLLIQDNGFLSANLYATNDNNKETKHYILSRKTRNN